MTLDQVMAFTVNPDHARQETRLAIREELAPFETDLVAKRR